MNFHICILLYKIFELFRGAVQLSVQYFRIAAENETIEFSGEKIEFETGINLSI